MKKTIQTLVSFLVLLNSCMNLPELNNPIEKGIPPTVTTSSIMNITSNTATGGGTVTSQGNSSVTARGVCWSTTQNPTTANSKTNDGTGSGSFVSDITGLSPSTTYYVKAYATNSAGTSYGNQVSFKSTGIPCPGIPTVTFAGKTYNTVLIDSQCWLRENLDVGIQILGSQNQTNNGVIEKYCYDNDPNNCNTYGGLYQWDEAMQHSTTPGTQGICPPGWHIPTLAEFETLKSAHNNDGNALRAIGQGSGTNTIGFSALTAGYRGTNGNFYGISTHFWSSTGYDATSTYNLYLHNNYSNIVLYGGDKVQGFSVRCLKD